MTLAEDPLYDAIDNAVDIDPLKLRDALQVIVGRCATAEENWEGGLHPAPRPGAPVTLSTPTGAWLPTAGIRNLIARELGTTQAGTP